jgi:hypothetical protein
MEPLVVFLEKREECRVIALDEAPKTLAILLNIRGSVHCEAWSSLLAAILRAASGAGNRHRS